MKLTRQTDRYCPSQHGKNQKSCRWRACSWDISPQSNNFGLARPLDHVDRGDNEDALDQVAAVMVEEMVVRLEGLHQQQSLLPFDPQAVEVPEAVEAEAVEVPPQVEVAEAV